MTQIVNAAGAHGSDIGYPDSVRKIEDREEVDENTWKYPLCSYEPGTLSLIVDFAMLLVLPHIS